MNTYMYFQLKRIITYMDECVMMCKKQLPYIESSKDLGKCTTTSSLLSTGS